MSPKKPPIANLTTESNGSTPSAPAHTLKNISKGMVCGCKHGSTGPQADAAGIEKTRETKRKSRKAVLDNEQRVPNVVDTCASTENAVAKKIV